MTYTSVTRIDTIRSLPSSDISSTYSLFFIGIGTSTVDTGFQHRMRIIDISNDTDGDMIFAFTSNSVPPPASDGTADNLFIPAGAFTLFDISTNGEPSGISMVFQIGTHVWVRSSTTPTKKAVYVECVYASGE